MLDARAIVTGHFSCILEEAEGACGERLREAAVVKGWPPARVNKALEEARKEIAKAASWTTNFAQACDNKERDEARQFFKDNAKDLGADAWGRPKDPIPENADLEILVSASKLVEPGKKVFILSRDKHFTGYKPEIAGRFGIGVGSVSQWGQTQQEWGIV